MPPGYKHSRLKALGRTWRDSLSSNIGRRFAIATIACSTMLAVLMTTLQLVIDYRTQLANYDAILGRIEITILPGLSESLWLLDDALINSQLQGIAQLEGVSRVELNDPQNQFVVQGTAEQHSRTLEYPVIRSRTAGQNLPLGTLIIYANYNHILRQVLQRALVVLATNFVKSICIAFVILLIFQQLVGRHIRTLAEFALAYDPEAAGQRIKLDTTDPLKKVSDNDEFDALERAVNEWSATVEHQLTQLRTTNREQAEFTYAISHDMKAPANTMQMLIKELEQNQSFDKDGLEMLDSMRLTVGRMSRLVEDVLDYSRLVGQQSAVELVDLNPLVADVVTDLSAEINDADAVINLSDLPIIEGYMFQLRILFQNLISNAIKFRAPDQAPKIDITSTRNNGTVSIVVTDNGIGIPEEYRKRVFALFQRLHSHSSYSGTGLGLSLCQRVMVNHGGTISIHDGMDNGTSFKLIFPINPD